MIRFISLIALLPAAMFATQALAQGAPTLKAAAVVSSGVVTLGDLIANAGAKAEFAVFRAPDLGQTGKVAAQDILDAATAHGLGGVDAAGLDRVSVTRASRVITANDLRAPLTAALSAQAGLENLEAVQAELDASFASVHLPVEADGAIEIRDAVWHKERGMFDAALVVRRIDGRDERRALRGKAIETVAVVTAKHDLARGAVIGPDDLETVRKPKAGIRDEALSDAAAAVGMEMRRTLRVGQTLHSADLGEPTLVKSGTTVTIVMKSGGLTLTATAQALRDGKRGEPIQVMNVQSKRVLQAVVTGSNEVAVNSPRMLISAAK